jgi:hypothetical protein
MCFGMVSCEMRALIDNAVSRSIVMTLSSQGALLSTMHTIG